MSGAILKQDNKILSGTLTSAGALTKQAQKLLAGAFTPAGALAAVKTALVSLTGTLTSSGTLVKSTATNLAGTIPSAGDLAKLTAHAFTGSIASAGAIIKQAGKTLEGYITRACVADTFAVPNGTPIDGRSPEVNIPGTVWLLDTGEMFTFGSRVASFASADRENIATLDAGVSDVIIEEDFTHDGGTGRLFEVMFRYTNTNNRWRVLTNANVLRLFEVNAGSSTQHDSSKTLTLTTGLVYHIRVEAVGAAIRASITNADNGVVSVRTNSATFNQSVTRHGFGVLTDTSFDWGVMAADNFELRALGPTGSLVKQTGKVLGGTLTPVGAIVKLTARALAGIIGWIGSVTGTTSALNPFDRPCLTMTDGDPSVTLTLADPRMSMTQQGIPGVTMTARGCDD